MDNKKTIDRVVEIYEAIKILNEELQVIRDECIHASYSVGFFSARQGALDVVKICDNCKENLGFPPKHEAEEFINKEKE